MSTPVFLFIVLLLIVTIAFTRRNKRSAQRRPGPHWLHFSVVVGLAIFFLSTQGALAADPGAASRQPLDADTLQKIQGMGQAVLAAKRSQPADPDVTSLKKTVEDLRDAIISLQSPIVQQGKMSLSTASTQSVESASTANPQAESRARAAVDAMRKQRLLVQQGAPQNASPEHLAFRQGTAARVQQLENEVEAALQSPPGEKAAKLALLRARLSATKPPSGTKAAVNATPSITTMTQHVGQQ